MRMGRDRAPSSRGRRAKSSIRCALDEFLAAATSYRIGPHELRASPSPWCSSGVVMDVHASTGTRRKERAMTEIIVHGIPFSPYVRSVIVALEIKGVPYRVQPID